MNNIPAATTANKKLDDDAFMKYDTSKEVGAFSTGCGALKEVYLEQAKRKVSFYEKELTRVQRYVKYHENLVKWNESISQFLFYIFHLLLGKKI